MACAAPPLLLAPPKLPARGTLGENPLPPRTSSPRRWALAPAYEPESSPLAEKLRQLEPILEGSGVTAAATVAVSASRGNQSQVPPVPPEPLLPVLRREQTAAATAMADTSGGDRGESRQSVKLFKMQLLAGDMQSGVRNGEAIEENVPREPIVFVGE